MGPSVVSDRAGPTQSVPLGPLLRSGARRRQSVPPRHYTVTRTFCPRTVAKDGLPRFTTVYRTVYKTANAHDRFFKCDSNVSTPTVYRNSIEEINYYFNAKNASRSPSAPHFKQRSCAFGVL